MKKKLGEVPTWGHHSGGTHGRALCLGLARPSLIRKTWSSFPGLKETSLNFTLDVDVVKQRKRLQCSDERLCQSSLREWGTGPRLCEPFLLVPTEGQVSGGVSRKV